MLRVLRTLPVAAVLAASTLPTSVAAQAPAPSDSPQAPVAQAPAAQDLPAAKELVARYVAAIGGRDAVLKHTHLRQVGAFEMPAQGLRGDLRVVQSKDGRTRMTIAVPGMGELAGGYDGTIGWSMNPMQGARVLEGKELAQMQEDAGFLPLLRESPGITAMETVEKSEVGGEACYKVKISYKSGRTAFDCYSIATGLLAGNVAVQETNLGTMQLVTVMSDWKEFGGVRFATRMTLESMGQQQVLSISEIVFDDAADADAFALPDAIKAIAAPKPGS